MDQNQEGGPTNGTAQSLEGQTSPNGRNRCCFAKLRVGNVGTEGGTLMDVEIAQNDAKRNTTILHLEIAVSLVVQTEDVDGSRQGGKKRGSVGKWKRRARAVPADRIDALMNENTYGKM
ncbi:hypothetical protein FH972_010396 [Carpinus fangiana]|uniref:Uncharacterized protein n=1 Tax=Carpinus fangiana TaxID=176857 RepID=A0A660KQ34_9ROSI|nr:hypothetical protein FH972_010396 [Carpinus fangiana]